MVSRVLPLITRGVTGFDPFPISSFHVRLIARGCLHVNDGVALGDMVAAA